jgi:aspartate-semialdehyde dehydrogenase
MRRASVLVVLCCLALSGCGSPEADELAAQVRERAERVQARAKDAGDRAEQLARQVRAALERIRRSVPRATRDDQAPTTRGRSEAEARKIVADARAIDAAGCFLLVLEGVMEEIAAEATRAVACPTIGIGASPSCDGQVLVTEDMLGLFERTPRFVKRYDDLAGRIEAAAAAYAGEVRGRTFPGEEQIYRPKKLSPFLPGLTPVRGMTPAPFPPVHPPYRCKGRWWARAAGSELERLSGDHAERQ